MCHGYEWEMLKQAYEREAARRNREQADETAGKSPETTPAQPTPAPSRNEEPVPV